MMEAARTSETLVNSYQTAWRYNPEDSHLLTDHRENLKSCPPTNRLTDYYEAEPFLECGCPIRYSRNSPPFMEPKDSLPCSQKPTTSYYPEPDQSSPDPTTLFP
jgi:hypothetical protein